MVVDSLYSCRVQSELLDVTGWVELTFCEWLRCIDIHYVIIIVHQAGRHAFFSLTMQAGV